MLLWGLGRYGLWDDESMTSLAALGVIESGDTSAIHGTNITAYREGLLLKNLHDRSTPPLSAYVAGVSMKVLGPSAFAARLPFAIMGVALMSFIVIAVMRSGLGIVDSAIWYLAFLGNTSLFLFLRQCRYYAPSILLTVLTVFLYLKWKGGKRRLVGIGLLIALLFASNYMACVALLACLGVDYLIWKRRDVVFGIDNILRLAAVIALPCLAILLVWNPLATKFGSYTQANSIFDRITLFFWNLRDMNEAGFLIAGLVLAAAMIALFFRDVWLMRGLLAMIVYTVVVSIVSPQLVKGASLADIRYLVPLIPLCIAVGVRAYLQLFRNKPILVLVLAFPFFWTNLASGTFLTQQGVLSVPMEYFGELLSPPSEPYSPTVDWIRANVPKGASIWVLPDYMTYPLMFHAPEPVYAWQLNPEQKKDPQFKDLPDIHFKGLQLPDYIIIFGPMVVQMRGMLQQWKQQGADYQEIYRINTFWKDLYRPELFWRTFKPITGFDPETQAIYIFKHLSSSGDLQKKHP